MLLTLVLSLSANLPKSLAFFMQHKIAWQNVKQTTVVNVFNKAGFAHLQEEEDMDQPLDG